MSKSTLSISLSAKTSHSAFPFSRTVEVPCRLPVAFNFKSADRNYTATINTGGSSRLADTCIDLVEFDGTEDPSAGAYELAARTAKSILATAKQSLGMGFIAPPQYLDTLRAIALAYEAECAAHDAQVKALQALPRELQNPGLVITHPSEREAYAGGAVGMLHQYVEWVFEQACMAQTEPAEAAAKVTP